MLSVRNKTIRRLGGLAETGNLLFLKLLLRNRSAAAAYPGRVFRTYMSLVGDERWPCRSVFEVLPEGVDPGRIVLEHLPSDVIDTPLEQLACLALLTRACQPSAIFEIGTFHGRTALNFALNAPPDCTVYTLDLPSEERARAMTDGNAADALIIANSETGCDYRGKAFDAKIEQLYGDSQTFDFSPWAESIDIVYVDGAHHYDAVRRDTENALRMVRPGGYVLWDEFANYGDYHDVTRAVLDTLPGGTFCQVANTQLAVYRKPA